MLTGYVFPLNGGNDGSEHYIKLIIHYPELEKEIDKMLGSEYITTEHRFSKIVDLTRHFTDELEKCTTKVFDTLSIYESCVIFSISKDYVIEGIRHKSSKLVHTYLEKTTIKTTMIKIDSKYEDTTLTAKFLC